MTQRLRARFPRELYFPDRDVETLDELDGDFVHRSVSVFEHWLSRDEFVAEPYLSYWEAVEVGQLKHFLERERRYLAAFLEMSAGGVLFDGEKAVHFRGRRDPVTRELFSKIVRERYRESVYFLGSELVLWPGWHLTHHLLAKSSDALERAVRVFERHGLHALD
ncbi:hypothetical protein [Caulobacter sp. 17J65-9]|uniref:hypothetical protein n=1 Tax=Caulobacter sp. 17J65-9 TaxID=2709382 RepID=UPI0013CDAE17|nr:hypothetical protein [Caulobacter sp. 17J65-9]NEX91342.1 hypothetical protein [Caulobacter sp. 17J65-9]